MDQKPSVLRKPLRLWPGVFVVVIQWLVMFALPIFAADQGGLAVIAGIVGFLAVIIWWLLFSRAPWIERFSAIVVMAIALAITSRLVHQSIATGMMGFMPYIYAAPLLSLALVAWAAGASSLAAGPRRISMGAAIALACALLTLVRTNGLTGDADSDFDWRWAPTAEQRLLARAGEERTARPRATTATPALETPAPATPVPAGEVQTPATPVLAAVWPGFRGTARDGVIRGARIETDWTRTPPVELWRRPIGPGWSSFAVAGDLLFTQEQRGGDELVSAYHLKTGAPVWRHRDAARFWESNAGAGPRATPTYYNGGVYTQGATGIVNALDARNGSLIWSRNAAGDARAKVPDWGIAGSPLVIDELVIVAAAGSLVAYELETGKLRWVGPAGGSGYSSPHLATIDGITQIVLVNGPGVIGVSPSDGALLWRHSWGGDSIVQPAVLDGDILVGSGSGLAANTGMLRVTVAREANEWVTKQRWTSTGLKPYFNDFVVHQGYAFGFDGSILACIDLADGTRKWKGGRYGHGQMVLLADQNLLLVLSEDGELALVSATADKFSEIARVPAIEGKSWNHPVLAGDILVVRNGEEMAALRLAR